MTTSTFDIDLEEFAKKDPEFYAILRDCPLAINSAESFNAFCQLVIKRWQSLDRECRDSSKFDNLMSECKESSENVIKTSWGAVLIKTHNHPKVAKYLLCRSGGYLALEMHEEKEESLLVEDGTGLLLKRENEQGILSAKLITPGFRTSFNPLEEHCIIGLENLVIYEESMDYKGMDQDLIFIFEPH